MSYKAFVSSTFIDLKEHRSRVIVALRKAGIHVDPMEDWTADSDEPKSVSVNRMHGCDLCILLIGARRGHQPENEALSITQMEVQEAVKRGIDVLPFLYDGESPWPPAHCELNQDEELKRWRAEIMEHRCVGTFTHDAGSLDAPVRDAVARWLQKQSWPEAQKTYLETLRDAHASIRFLGVGHYKDIQDRPIEDLFVDPYTASQHISPDTPPERWPETSPLLELLSSEKRLVILGDPGSGKSTLVSWIVWSLSREGENQWKKALQGRMPIVMVLRELSLDNVVSWDDLLAAYFKHLTARLLGRPQYARYIRELLENGRVMIMLDGLDEVGDRQVQEKLRQAVWEGMRKYEACVWLLTSRVVGYLGYHESQDSEVSEAGTGRHIIYARQRYVAPFSNHQIKKFAQNWFTTRDRSTVRASEESSRLINAIHSNPYTLRLARIPNLLTMMALIHRERARLPHGRALLYTDIATAYLQSIDEHRRIERLGYSLRDQKLWLGRVGFEMQLRRHKRSSKRSNKPVKEILVEGQAVRQWVVTAMRDAGRKDSNDEAADAFLDEICRRSGLLLPRGEDQFAFTHLSFQEFFAAVFFVPQFVRPPRRAGSKDTHGARRSDLHTYVSNQVWHETLVFLVELMFAEHPDWLEELLFCLFGEGFSDVAPPVKIEAEEDQGVLSQAILLARLAVDPHTGLAERDLKWPAITRCCTFEAAEQKRREADIVNGIIESKIDVKPDTFKILLGAERGELPHVWVTLTNALREADVVALSLAEAPIGSVVPLADLSNLRVLDLYETNITDLSPLSSLEELEILDLRQIPVTDVGPLAALKGLHSLYLSGTKVSELGPLVALTSLKLLELSDILAKDVTPLADFTWLESLDLSRNDLSDIKPLSALNGLRSLSLGGTKLNDLGPLATLICLQSLDLSESGVSDISPLASLIGLRSLNLRETKVRDLGPLAALKGLQSLDLSDTEVTDVGPLATLTRLQALNLSGTRVTDVAPLAALTELTSLELSLSVPKDAALSLQLVLPDCHISLLEEVG